MHTNSFSKNIIFLNILLLLFFACKKSKVDNTIPYVPVSTTIQLSLPQYVNLNNPGGSVLIQGGYKGIIVYRSGINEFVAFDRACPYDPTVDASILVIDSSGITTVDRHCGSKFNLTDGSITHGPATLPMKRYNCSYIIGDNSVYISN